MANLLIENAVSETLEQLFTAQNLQLTDQWTFPDFTHTVFGDDLTTIKDSLDVLNDLVTNKFVSHYYLHALDVYELIHGGPFGGWG